MIESFGTVKTNKDGYATIKLDTEVINENRVRAKCGDQTSNEATVIVTNELYGVHVNGNHIMQTGETNDLTATLTNKYGEPLTGETVYWYKREE